MDERKTTDPLRCRDENTKYISKNKIQFPFIKLNVAINLPSNLHDLYYLKMAKSAEARCNE
jgi:hypothetical protein